MCTARMIEQHEGCSGSGDETASQAASLSIALVTLTIVAALRLYWALKSKEKLN
jgi:hypothetical protein